MMPRNILSFILIVLFTGCTSNYYLSETKELNEPEKRQRHQELEQILKKAKPGDALSLLLYNGDTADGTFYAYVDGFVSIRIGDSFVDKELTEIRGIAFQPQGRVRTIMMVLMFATAAGIVTQFGVTH